jgi:glycosyltransferase involved in cell wall biosynthesis
LDVELIICDDNSQDGTPEVVSALNKSWIRLIVRTSYRGLSPAVIEGLRNASNEILVVMDADRSHPADAIPLMLSKLDRGFDFVIGSRYIEGGSTDAEWGLFRWINSKVATLLAKPFTSIKDPMSGFFTLKRSTFNRAAELNPVGYKIGLVLCHGSQSGSFTVGGYTGADDGVVVHIDGDHQTHVTAVSLSRTLKNHRIGLAIVFSHEKLSFHVAVFKGKPVGDGIIGHACKDRFDCWPFHKFQLLDFDPGRCRTSKPGK